MKTPQVDALPGMTPLGINPKPSIDRLEMMKAAFARNLAKTVADDPGYYAWPPSELSAVTTRMLAAIDRSQGMGGINITSKTFKMTAKEFGIKNTYKAWAAWLAQ